MGNLSLTKKELIWLRTFIAMNVIRSDECSESIFEKVDNALHKLR